MSSVYPPYGGMQGVSCQRCHVPLPANEATCRNCGLYNAPIPGNNSAVQRSSVNGSWSEGTPQPFYGQNRGQYVPPSWGQFPASPASTPPPQGQNTFNSPPSAPFQPENGNFLGAPTVPSSLMKGNGYTFNQAMPSALPATPPVIVPQQLSGLLSPGQIGPQSGSVPQASYRVPSTGPISQSSYGMPQAGFQQSGAPTVPGQAFPGTGPFNPSRTQPSGLQPFSGGILIPSSSNPPRFAQALQETAPKRRMKPWMIALVVLLMIVLVGGAFVGYTLINKQNNTVSTTSAGNASQGTSLFTDTFKNNANGWSLGADPGIFSISVAGGSLVLEDNRNELLWEPVPGNRTFSDFTLSSDAVLSQGDQTNGYGFYIRGTSVRNSAMATYSTYYRFELYGDGSYAIFKGSSDAHGNSTYAKLVNYTFSSAIYKQGTINHVTITAKGSSLSLMVNGQVVKTLTDTAYTNGAIAPFVSNMQNAKPGAQAKFSNLTISTA